MKHNIKQTGQQTGHTYWKSKCSNAQALPISGT